ELAFLVEVGELRATAENAFILGRFDGQQDTVDPSDAFVGRFYYETEMRRRYGIERKRVADCATWPRELSEHSRLRTVSRNAINRRRFVAGLDRVVDIECPLGCAYLLYLRCSLFRREEFGIRSRGPENSIRPLLVRNSQTVLGTMQNEIADRVIGALVSGGGVLRQRVHRRGRDAPGQQIPALHASCPSKRSGGASCCHGRTYHLLMTSAPSQHATTSGMHRAAFSRRSLDHTEGLARGTPARQTRRGDIGV